MLAFLLGETLGVGTGNDKVTAVGSANFRQLVSRQSNFLPADPECAAPSLYGRVARVRLRYRQHVMGVTDF